MEWVRWWQQFNAVAGVAEWVVSWCICIVRTWHFEPWPEAGGIARPVSAHRTMTSDSTNDKLLRIALREIMPIRLLLSGAPGVCDLDHCPLV
jgi:hypothetical protein